MKNIWHPKPPAADEQIERLNKSVTFDFPQEYLDLLKKNNGGEGALALPPKWLQLWTIDEVIDNSSQEFYVKEFPGYLFFASNGGLESIAMRHAPDDGSLVIVMLDTIAGIDSAVVIAHDFDTFVNAIGKSNQVQ